MGASCNSGIRDICVGGGGSGAGRAAETAGGKVSDRLMADYNTE